MNATTILHKGLSAHTETSTSPSLNREVKSQPESSNSTVLIFEASVIHPAQRAGWRDLSERTKNVQKDQRKAAAIARARARLADDLHERNSLAYLRMKKGLSQSKLASLIETSQARISRIENGQDDPLLSTTKKLANALDVDMNVITEAVMNHSRNRNV